MVSIFYPLLNIDGPVEFLTERASDLQRTYVYYKCAESARNEIERVTK